VADESAMEHAVTNCFSFWLSGVFRSDVANGKSRLAIRVLRVWSRKLIVERVFLIRGSKS
jgi:hypothetical protein